MPEPSIPRNTSGFHVFSIRPKAAANSTDEITDPYTIRLYKHRQSHRKSRLGCAACKAKRVKCDEQQPSCGRCQRTNTTCDYALPRVATKPKADRRHDTKSEAITHPTSNRAAIAVARSQQIQAPRSLEKYTKETYLLKHYDAITGGKKDTITCSDTLVGSQSHEYRMAILRLGQEHSHLKHAIFAAAALHLTHHDLHEYRLVKLTHLQVALEEFQTAISKPITKGEVDAILLTAMMINMQHFSWIDSTSPEDSWVFSAEPSRLDWLSVQLGLLQLVTSTSKFHADSLLAPVWAVSAYELHGTDGLPDDLATLCGIHDEFTDEEAQNNPYYDALALLAPLMSMERGSASIVQYIRFIRGVPKFFFNLAQRNDLRALLILSFWFGLMASVDFWWTWKRAKRDCTALCMYLDIHGDDMIRSLLHFPAEACGYKLRGPQGSEPTADEDSALMLLNVDAKYSASTS